MPERRTFFFMYEIQHTRWFISNKNDSNVLCSVETKNAILYEDRSTLNAIDVANRSFEKV